MPERRKSREDPAREAVAEAASVAAAREAAGTAGGRPRGRGGRQPDPLTGELRRRDVLPLLVLHFIGAGPSYGNQLMDRISAMTEGVLSVNPNTMYPLLRQLEGEGLVEGRWEHPDRRSRRIYTITAAGRKRYGELHAEVRPFLESTARSIERIVEEVYG